MHSQGRRFFRLKLEQPSWAEQLYAAGFVRALQGFPYWNDGAALCCRSHGNNPSFFPAGMIECLKFADLLQATLASLRSSYRAG
jgi:hypothetical protein